MNFAEFATSRCRSFRTVGLAMVLGFWQAQRIEHSSPSNRHACPLTPFSNDHKQLMCLLCDEEGWESIRDAPILADGDDLTSGEPKDISDDDEDSTIQPGNHCLN